MSDTRRVHLGAMADLTLEFRGNLLSVHTAGRLFIGELTDLIDKYEAAEAKRLSSTVNSPSPDSKSEVKSGESEA